MPNKRDPNKVMIGVYVDKDVRDTIKEILDTQKVTITDFIYAQFLKLIKKEEYELIEELKKRDLRTKEGKAIKIKKNRKET